MWVGRWLSVEWVDGWLDRVRGRWMSVDWWVVREMDEWIDV